MVFVGRGYVGRTRGRPRDGATTEISSDGLVVPGIELGTHGNKSSDLSTTPRVPWTFDCEFDFVLFSFCLIYSLYTIIYVAIYSRPLNI